MGQATLRREPRQLDQHARNRGVRLIAMPWARPRDGQFSHHVSGVQALSLQHISNYRLPGVRGQWRAGLGFSCVYKTHELHRPSGRRPRCRTECRSASRRLERVSRPLKPELGVGSEGGAGQHRAGDLPNVRCPGRSTINPV